MTHRPFILQATRLTAVSLVLLLAGCGMKGPLTHPKPPPPPPTDSKLVTPPTVAPAPGNPATPQHQP